MKTRLSCLMTGRRIVAFAALASLATPGGGARAQEAGALLACRSIDYAFADQERDYYAFYAFDRHYGAPGDTRAVCGAGPERRELAAHR